MIDSIELIKRHENKFVVKGTCRDEEKGSIFQVSFFQSDIKKADVFIKVYTNEFMSIEDVSLERGIYRIGFARLTDRKSRTCGEISYYLAPVMAGSRYPVKIDTVETTMYGHTGLKVKIVSKEYPVGENILYYTLKLPGEILSKIRFRIHSGAENEDIEFFIPEVRRDQVEFKSFIPNLFDITADN